MAFLAGDGSHRQRLLRSLERRDREVVAEVLNHSLLHKQQRQHDRERNEDVERSPNSIDPEVADLAGRAPCNPANDRDRDRHSDRGRHEVVHGELRHLREVGHRLLADVGLPVGVGRERGRGLEGLPFYDARKVLGIERERSLQPQREVSDKHGRDAEEQQTRRVIRPVLICFFVDSAEAIDRPLEKSEPVVRALVHLVHVNAHRLRHREQHRAIEEDLNPAVRRHQNFSGRSSE